jgi:hypothetical protein
MSLWCFRTATAQTPTSTIIGVVTDPSGAAVPDAAATVRNTGTGDEIHAKTNGQGTFTVPDLPRGQYDITVEKPGFQTQRQTGIQLSLQQEARIEISLGVGSVSQTVDVKAEVPLVNTENGARGETFENAEIEQLPGQGSGRQFVSLAYLTAGVTSGPQGTGGSGISANGARPDNTNILIDGTQSRDLASGYPISIDSTNVESIAEVKMLTNNYSAEYGTVSGGVMTVVLKTGTNQLHGAAYEFTHNSVFDAKNYFLLKKAPLSYYDSGGELDGPVYIPHLYDGRNRTFFMLSEEVWNQHSPLTGLITVPNAQVRVGDLSQYTSTLKDPFAGNTPFPGAKIPSSMLNPISQNLLKYWPDPELNTLANNYSNDVGSFQTMERTSAKIDEILTPKDRLSLTLTVDSTNYNAVGVISNTVDTFKYPKHRRWWVPGISYYRDIKPNLIAEFKVGLNRNYQYTGSYFLGQNIAQQLGITGTALGAYSDFPFFNVSGYAQIGDPTGNPSLQVTQTYQYSGNMTWVTGRHVIKFGGEALHGDAEDVIASSANGNFQFLGNWTGNAFGDFLLGLPDSTSRLLNPTAIYMRTNTYAGFIQDDFNATPRLTLNLGLRYDLSTPPSEKYGRWSNFLTSTDQVVIASQQTLPNLQQQLAAANLTGKVVLASQVGLPQALAYPDKTDFGPRAGFAWRPFGGNRTVIRGGYGLSYSSDLLSSYWTTMGGEYPFVINQTFPRQPSNPSALTLSNPFPAAIAALGGTTTSGGTVPHITTPRVHNYNVTIEHELGWNTAIEVAYSGSAGRDLSHLININQPYYFSPQNWAPNGTIPSPYAGWGSISYVQYGSVSNYNAGLFTIRHQLSSRFLFRFNYTYGKSLDDASLINGTTPGGFSGVQDSQAPWLEYGRSDFDARQIFSFTFYYAVPFHSLLARGWELTASGRGSTGFPITPQVSNANLALGQAPRPNRVCDGTLANPTLQEWFNVSCFQAVPNGQYTPGNSGRGIISGPPWQGYNISFSRNFHFAGEKQKLQIRCDISNILNHPNFYEPSPYVNVASGATISTADSPRQIQWAARYTF